MLTYLRNGSVALNAVRSVLGYRRCYLINKHYWWNTSTGLDLERLQTRLDNGHVNNDGLRVLDPVPNEPGVLLMADVESLPSPILGRPLGYGWLPFRQPNRYKAAQAKIAADLFVALYEALQQMRPGCRIWMYGVPRPEQHADQWDRFGSLADAYTQSAYLPIDSTPGEHVQTVISIMDTWPNDGKPRYVVVWRMYYNGDDPVPRREQTELLELLRPSVEGYSVFQAADDPGEDAADIRFESLVSWVMAEP